MAASFSVPQEALLRGAWRCRAIDVAIRREAGKMKEREAPERGAAMRPSAIIASGLVILAAFALASPAPAEGTIRVVTSEFPPLTTNEAGQPGGVVLEILREAGKRAGVPLDFAFLPWQRAQLEVRSRADVLIIPFTRTPDRESQYQWVAPALEFDTVLITLVDTPASLEDARKLVVGYVRGTSFKDAAIQAGFTHIEEATDDVTNAKKLKRGHIQGWITMDLMAGGVYRQAGFDPAELKHGPKLGQTKISYIAASPSFPKETAKRISDAVDQMKADGSLQAIVKRYL
jgi:polar amino acid transport system substrate-binding protein